MSNARDLYTRDYAELAAARAVVDEARRELLRDGFDNTRLAESIAAYDAQVRKGGGA